MATVTSSHVGPYFTEGSRYFLNPLHNKAIIIRRLADPDTWTYFYFSSTGSPPIPIGTLEGVRK